MNELKKPLTVTGLVAVVPPSTVSATDWSLAPRKRNSTRFASWGSIAMMRNMPGAEGGAQVPEREVRAAVARSPEQRRAVGRSQRQVDDVRIRAGELDAVHRVARRRLIQRRPERRRPVGRLEQAVDLARDADRHHARAAHGVDERIRDVVARQAARRRAPAAAAIVGVDQLLVRRPRTAGSGAAASAGTACPARCPPARTTRASVWPLSADEMSPKFVTSRISWGRSAGVRRLSASGNAPFARALPDALSATTATATNECSPSAHAWTFCARS